MSEKLSNMFSGSSAKGSSKGSGMPVLGAKVQTGDNPAGAQGKNFLGVPFKANGNVGSLFLSATHKMNTEV